MQDRYLKIQRSKALPLVKNRTNLSE